MTTNPLFQHPIISSAELSLEEINLILDTAEKIKQQPMPDYLRGKLLASCFFEPSTRTRLSFEAAMTRLGGQVIGFAQADSTSTKKQESLSDSMRVIGKYVDALVLRHHAEGAARLAAEVCDKPIINAGDGANLHPSQTLLDLFSIRESQQRLENLHIAFVGDLKYGRTVHSLAKTCARYPNIRFYFVAADALKLPEHICDFLYENRIKFSFHTDINDIINRVDILYMTRMQRERFEANEFNSIQTRYRLTVDTLKAAKPTLKIMHPLPRVDEITVEVDDTAHAYYFQQAENGLYVRQALLALLLRPEMI
ncbi:MAG: aspartate carbamoyltransferase [Pseudomonadota bacterium]